MFSYKLYESRNFNSIFKYIKFVIYQYVKFVSIIIAVIVFKYWLLSIGDGPLWHYFQFYVMEPCKHTTVQNLLLISNYGDDVNPVSNYQIHAALL